MRKSKTILFVFIWLLLFSSCEDKLDPKPYTYTQVLTGEVSKTWRMTLIELTSGGEVQDRFTIDCASDDEYTFYATSDRLYRFDTGQNSCGDDESPALTDSWSFTNATATLSFILPIFTSAQSLNFIVIKADPDDLVLEIFLDEEGVESYRIHFKLKDEG